MRVRKKGADADVEDDNVAEDEEAGHAEEFEDDKAEDEVEHEKVEERRRRPNSISRCAEAGQERP